MSDRSANLSEKAVEKPTDPDYYLKSYQQNGNPKLQTVGNRVYAIQYFQSPHQDEYLMTEIRGNIPHGEVQLFEYGVLKMAWTMNNGVRTGILTVYEDGVVEKELHWENFDSNVPFNREVINKAGSKRVLRITDKKSNVLIYRGDCDQLLRRCGKGMEFDLKTGLPVYYGVYKDDALFHIHQQIICWNKQEVKPTQPVSGRNTTLFSNGFGGGFANNQGVENNDLLYGRMVEYGGNEKDSNIDLASRKPVYIGGFNYDKRSWTISRSGEGSIVSETSGIATQQVSSQQNNHSFGHSPNTLCNGWWFNCEGRTSIREIVENDAQKKKELGNQQPKGNISGRSLHGNSYN